MLLSSRQKPPRLSPHRSNSHNSLTAARALLANTPPPSPGLPTVLPRHGKKKPRANSQKIIPMLAWLTTCTIFFWAASRIVEPDQSLAAISYLSPNTTANELVGDGLPEGPSPVIVTDQRGRSKWTISIPPQLRFPLRPEQYVDVCDKSMEASKQVALLKSPHSDQSHAHTAHHGYYYRDPHFLDIADAESHRLLPGISSPKVDSRMRHSLAQDPSLEQCARSLTYALETSSAGLGHTIQTLWLAYGLAQSEDRAFFIDDTNWAYGSYATYFKPPPSTGCLAPPKTQIVPCPHQARHLLVSAVTTSHTFGHMFTGHFEDGRKMGVMRQHKIFGMMRAGYEALFEGKFTGADGSYFNRRIAELNATSRDSGGEVIGIHVRHGDRHPMEYQYQKSYIPLEKYLDTALNLTNAQPHSQMVIASDDPDVYLDPLITSLSSSSSDPGISKAQSHITLASRKSLSASGQSGLGWEGGFFKDAFWALGLPVEEQMANVTSSSQFKSSSSRQARTGRDGDAYGKEGEKKKKRGGPGVVLDPHTHPSPASLQLRQLVGRAYLLDLAVLGQSDKVVCAVSAYGCRILAVMMGWERAIVGGGWVNVDGEFAWRGVDW